MSIEKAIKRNIKKLYSSFGVKRNSLAWKKQITEAEKASQDEIPELTQKQTDDIRSYWNRYGIEVPCLEWHKFFYARTGCERPDFVAKTTFNYDIKPYLSDLRFAPTWSDKSYLDYFIKNVNTPVNIVRNVNGNLLDLDFNYISQQEAESKMNQYDALVIKPTVFTNTGKGVRLLKPPFQIDKLINEYKRDFVIQLPLRQHAEMAKLNESSVNTIRFNTVLLDGKANVMSCFVKVGQTGQFADNNGKKRYFIGINSDDGTMKDYAINHDMVRFSTIPSGFDFANKAIPSYEKACEMVCRAHKQLAHFGLAFWDVCIREDGEPCIVEVNLTAPDSAIAQAAAGPFFGKYAEQVMEYVVKRRNVQ